MDSEEAIQFLNTRLWNARHTNMFTGAFWNECLLVHRYRSKSGEYKIWEPPQKEVSSSTQIHTASSIIPMKNLCFICGNDFAWSAFIPYGTGINSWEMCLKVDKNLESILNCIVQIDSYVPLAQKGWNIAMDLNYLQRLGLIAELQDEGVIRIQQTHIPYVDRYYSADFMWNYTCLKSDNNRPQMLVRTDGTQWIVEGEGTLVEASAPGTFKTLRELAFTLEKTLNRPRFSELERN